jgi:hypothetical protein
MGNVSESARTRLLLEEAAKLDLVSAARRLLDGAGYATRVASSVDSLIFEDDSLFGFVWVAPDVRSILESWHEKQAAFLRDRDQQLQKSRGKSWNIYSVFLAESDPSPSDENSLALIEEDFRGTRKLARAGLHTTSQATRALLPLIPLQNLVVLGEEDTMIRLKARLVSMPGNLFDAIVDSTAPAQLADFFRRLHED